jgi:putative flavoprotein involved in K+ transport
LNVVLRPRSQIGRAAWGPRAHDGGGAGRPGLYALGLPVLRRRKSTFIHGIEDDAREVIYHPARYLAGR